MKSNISVKIWKYLFYVAFVSGLYSVNAFSSDNSSKLLAVADDIVSAFNERNPERFCSVLNFDHLARLSAEKSFEVKTEQDNFVKGFLSTTSQACNQIIQNVQRSGGQAKFLRITKRAGSDRILVRLDLGESGFDYMEYLAERKANGDYQVIDWYQLSTGQLFSDTIGAISRLMIDPNPGLVMKFLGVKKVDQDVVDQIRTMTNLIREGKFDEASDTYTKLPSHVKDKRIMITVGMTAAIRGGNEARYKELLGDLAQHHGDDPSAAFMLIDYYFYQKTWDKVLASVDAIESRFGQDAMLELLRANVYLGNNELEKLEHHARKAIEIEPDFVDPYFTLSTGYVNAEKHAEAVKIFDVLVSKFGYQFNKDDFYAEPLYSKFVQSKAFKDWPHVNAVN